MSDTKLTQWYFCCTLLCLSNFLSQLVLFVYSFWFCFMGFICDFVCVHIYVCVQVCICVFIYLYVCSICACMCLCAYLYICVLCVYLFLYVCIVCVSANVCVCWLVCVMYVCMGMSEEARRGLWIPWNWTYRWLWAAQCGCWELDLDPLQNQYALLTAEQLSY